MTLPILNVEVAEFQPWGRGVSIPGAGEASVRYQARIAFLGRQLGAKKLGYNITVGRAGESLEYWHGE